MTWRSFGIALLVLIAGLAADTGAEYYFATTPMGQGILRDFLVSQVQKQAAEFDAAAASSSVKYYKNGVLPVPVAWVTDDYFDAINNVLSDTTLLNNASVELNPLLDKLNLKSLSCSFDGFFDLMSQARASANHNQALAAQFVTHLQSLSAANAKTQDAVTKTQTQKSTETGLVLASKLKAFDDKVQALLYGDTPTSADLTELQQRIADALAASQSFADAFGPLVQRIVEEDLRLTAVASSTPAR